MGVWETLVIEDQRDTRERKEKRVSTEPLESKVSQIHTLIL